VFIGRYNIANGSQRKFVLRGIPSLIRGGDLAGMLEKRYSGNLSMRSPSDQNPSKAAFSRDDDGCYKI
jgi:hypothetical protein